jgi:hypothetical protein
MKQRFKGPIEVRTASVLYGRDRDLYHRHRSIDRRRVRSVVATDITQVRPLISPDYDEGIIEEQNVHEMGRAGRESGRADQ